MRMSRCVPPLCVPPPVQARQAAILAFRHTSYSTAHQVQTNTTLSNTTLTSAFQRETGSCWTLTEYVWRKPPVARFPQELVMYTTIRRSRIVAGIQFLFQLPPTGSRQPVHINCTYLLSSHCTQTLYSNSQNKRKRILYFEDTVLKNTRWSKPIIPKH